MKTVWLLLAAVVLSVAGCESATVPARDGISLYDFRLITPEADSLVLRWPVGSTIRVYVNRGTDPERFDALRSAFASGAEAWQAAALYGEYEITEVNSPDNADAVLTWSGDLLPVVVSDCAPGGSRAYTTFCLDDSGEHLRPFPLANSDRTGTVRFLLTVRSTEGGEQARVNALVAHELGHLLGIAQHSRVQTDLMHEDQVSLSVPNARDRATVQVLYHTRPDITP